MKLFRNYFKQPAATTPTQAATAGKQEPQDQNQEEYTFEVVGESFRRDHLIQLIKKHKLVDVGELYSTATLKLEPTNDFDPTAVMVIVDDLHVGYIPKSMSAEMTDYIKAKGGNTLQVPVRVGWDSDSPEPLIGVRLKMEDF
jgi:hypothetical protein